MRGPMNYRGDAAVLCRAARVADRFACGRRASGDSGGGEGEMTDTERLEAIKAALGHDTPADALTNMLGAMQDMEHDGWVVDATCQHTLGRVVRQLAEACALLKSSN